MNVARWLDISDISTGGAWVDLPRVDKLEQEYRRLTDWSAPEGPAGLWVVLARLAFTRNGTLPPGGVLLEVACDVVSPAAFTSPIQARVSVHERTTSSGKRLVTVECAMRSTAGGLTRPTAMVTFALFWPTADSARDTSTLGSAS